MLDELLELCTLEIGFAGQPGKSESVDSFLYATDLIRVVSTQASRLRNSNER